MFVYRGGSAKVEDAIECYQRAANLYKMAKKWNEAGSAFCEAANLHVKTGSRHDAATHFVDAANCYKKNNVEGNNFITIIQPFLKNVYNLNKFIV